MILVTGATGIVGSQLIFDLCTLGKQVKALKRATSDLLQVKKRFTLNNPMDGEKLFSEIIWIDADITDKYALYEAFLEVTEVYHCAAMVSFNPADREDIYFTNIDGTQNITDLCLENNIRKLCYVSSIAVTGQTTEQYIDENHFPQGYKNKSPYVVSKIRAELIIRSAIEEGLNAVIVNPGIILGPGNWNSDSSALVSYVDKNSAFYPPGSTGFVDVRDVSKAMIGLMETDIKNERFILVSENLSYQELFKKIAVKLHKKPPSVGLTKFLAHIAYRVAAMIAYVSQTAPMITKDSVMASFNKSLYTGQKICDKLQFEYLSTDNTIEHMVNTYKLSKKDH